jgi:hypothetical protein
MHIVPVMRDTVAAGCLLFALASCGGNTVDEEVFFDSPASWETLHGTYANKPISVRIHRGLADHVGHPGLRYQAAIGLTFREPGKRGYPGAADEVMIARVRRVITREVVATKIGVLAVLTTTDGRCDYIVYTGDKGAVTRAFERIRDAADDYAMDLSVKRDDKWVTYTWFSSLKE